MTSILKSIETSALIARKAHNTADANLLTTLLSEATIVGKNAGRESTDAEVIAMVKKFIKNNDDTIKLVPDPAALVHENEILSTFLPKQMTVDEIKTELESIFNSMTDHSPKAMGALLKEFKTRHAGTYDGATASSLAKILVS